MPSKNNILFRIRKIKVFLGKIFIFSAQHIALTCVLLFFVSLIFGGLVFLKYIVFMKDVEPNLLGSFELNQEVYNDVLNIWQKEETRFNEANFKKWVDIFNKSVIIEEELTE